MPITPGMQTSAVILLPLPFAIAAAAALLVLPLVLLAHWTANAEKGGEGAWFRFVVRAQWLTLGALFFDVPAVMTLGLERALLPGTVFLGLSPAVVAWVLAVVFALTHLSALSFASRRVARRLRDVRSAANTWGGKLRAVAARFLPVFGMLGALAALQHHEWRVAGACVLAGFGLGLWLQLTNTRVLGLSLEAVTAGPLRERVFALAADAGVKVEQLFVLAARDARLVNAFAMQGRRVLITDTLLDRLSRRQVDAVIAHELAHLKLRHPLGLSASVVVASTVALLALFPLGAWGYALGGLIVWQSFLMVSRSFEWAADRQAVAWTGDPEGLITALAAISRSNDTPLQWAPWTGVILTHPSTEARAQALARAAAWPAERAGQLLAAPTDETERWPYETATAPPVTGSAARARNAHAIGWASFAACTLTACAIVQCSRAFPAVLPAGWVILAGTVAGWLTMLLMFDQLALSGYRGWRAPLAAKLGADDRARYAGLAPGTEPRLYEGFSDWDIGFLTADASGLMFHGERTRFVLARDRVVGITMVRGLPSWFAAPRVAIEWRTGAGGTQVFTVRDAEVRRMHGIPKTNRALAAQLERELSRSGGPHIATHGKDSPPDPGQVTSEDPRQVAGWRTLPVLVVPAGLLSCAAGLLLGLPFWPLTGPGVFEVFVSTLGAAVVTRLPLLKPQRRPARESRALDRAA